MGKTIRGERGVGYEYWQSRLHSQGEAPGRFTKERTHRKERQQGKNICKQVLDFEDEDNFTADNDQ